MEEPSGLEATAPIENQPYMHREKDLNIDEAVEILLNPDMTRISANPAVLPRAGDVYVYVFNSYAKSEISRIRSDGYTWYSCSGKVLRSKARGLRVQKYYWTIQTSNESGDHRFKRQEYRLVQESEQGQRRSATGTFVVIIHYLGDEKVTENANGILIKANRSKGRSLMAPGESAQAQGSSGSPVVTVVSSDGTETYSAVNSIASVEGAPRLRAERRSEMISVTPMSVRSLARPHDQVKRSWQLSSPADAQTAPKSTKLSKNNLLGQQVQATLDALEGDELIAARDEIYDFLRKWDKD